jgi:flagellar hook-length control protein FliK
MLAESSYQKGLKNQQQKHFGSILKTGGQSADTEAVTGRDPAISSIHSKTIDIKPGLQPTPGPVVPERGSFIDQVTPALSRMIEQGESRLKIVLHPEHLGALRIELISEGEQVRARFFVESGEVKQLIEASLPEIKEALSRDGVVVEHFQVDIDRDSDQPSPYDNRTSGRGPNRSLSESAEPGMKEETDDPLKKKGIRYFGYNSMEIIA